MVESTREESALIETVQQSECVTDPQCGKLRGMTYEHPGAVCPVHCGNVQCQDVQCVQWCIMSSVYSVALGFRELTDESSSAHLSALPAPLITYHFIFLIDIYFLCALILSLVTKLLAIMVLVITEISITWRTML